MSMYIYIYILWYEVAGVSMFVFFSFFPIHSCCHTTRSFIHCAAKRDKGREKSKRRLSLKKEKGYGSGKEKFRRMT